MHHAVSVTDAAGTYTGSAFTATTSSIGPRSQTTSRAARMFG